MEESVQSMNSKVKFRRKLCGHNLEFYIQGHVGKGGNGDVYDILIDKSSITLEYDKYVVKILRTNNTSNKQEREKRFIEEIKTTIKLNYIFKNQCVLPIVDNNYDTINQNQELWYVMPKAQCLWDYILNNDVDAVNKIE